MYQKKEKRFNKQMIMVLFIAFIMVSSIIAFIWKGSGPKEKYNDFVLTQKDNYWAININNQFAYFLYHPLEVESINVSGDIINRLSNTLEIDTTSDPDDIAKEPISLAQYELSQALDQHFNIYLMQGFTKNNSYNLPVFSCKNATQFVPVLYFKSSNSTKISSEGNCVIIEAERSDDFIKAKERLLYGMFGVIR